MSFACHLFVQKLSEGVIGVNASIYSGSMLASSGVIALESSVTALLGLVLRRDCAT
jgi:hypothetical protein